MRAGSPPMPLQGGGESGKMDGRVGGVNWKVRYQFGDESKIGNFTECI